MRHHPLSRLEDCFGAWVPTPLFPKAREKANSRQRDYTPCRTFWCGLWHSLHPGAAGREVVRQLQALLRLHKGRVISEEDGAYFRARKRLPLNELSKALATTAQQADALAPPLNLLHGRRLKAIAGTTFTLHDTPKNRKEYPAVQCRPEEPSFPMRRLGPFPWAVGDDDTSGTELSTDPSPRWQIRFGRHAPDAALAGSLASG